MCNGLGGSKPMILLDRAVWICLLEIVEPLVMCCVGVLARRQLGVLEKHYQDDIRQCLYCSSWPTARSSRSWVQCTEVSWCLKKKTAPVVACCGSPRIKAATN